MIGMLVPGAALVVTYVGTHELCDRAAAAVRAARHRRLTRRRGQMLARAMAQAGAEGWTR